MAEDVEELNDRLAREHPINDYYAKSPLPMRLIEYKRLALIRDMVDEVPGGRILEVGSGGGHVLAMFRRSKLVGSDVAGVFLETARKNLEGYDVELIKGELQEQQLPAESFDRIICTEVLEHVEDPDVILTEIGRLLKPDGIAVITIPNDPLINRLKQIVRVSPVGWVLGNRIEWGGDKYHLHQWTPGEFRSYLERWFDVEQYRAAPLTQLPIRACFKCRVRR